MMKIQQLIPVCLVVMSTISCRSGSDGKNTVSDTIKVDVDSFTNSNSQQNMTTDMDSTVVAVDLGLAPNIYNAKVLSRPNPASIHPDWEQSKLGKAWSLFATKKITNKLGVFYEGDLVSPRGGKMENGPYYFIASEWEMP